MPLGTPGLPRGWRAGRHWQAPDLLVRFGATPSEERVTVARKTQLATEQDQHPPFPGGMPGRTGRLGDADGGTVAPVQHEAGQTIVGSSELGG